MREGLNLGVRLTSVLWSLDVNSILTPSLDGQHSARTREAVAATSRTSLLLVCYLQTCLGTIRKMAITVSNSTAVLFVKTETNPKA